MTIRLMMIAVAVVTLVSAVGVLLPAMVQRLLLVAILSLGIPSGLALLTMNLVSPRGPFSRKGMPNASEIQLGWAIVAFVSLSIVYFFGLWVAVGTFLFLRM
jgi:hypothetical protein